MKRILCLVCICVFYGSIAYSKTDLNSLIELTSAKGYYCGNDIVGFDDSCIKSIDLVFFNNTKKYISEISLILIITDENNNIIYKRPHTVKINLGAYKTATATTIELVGTVSDQDISNGDLFFSRIKVYITAIK